MTWTHEARMKAYEARKALGMIRTEPTRMIKHGVPRLDICARGLHDLSGENLGLHKRPNGTSDRFCRACERETAKNHRLKNIEEERKYLREKQKKYAKRDRDLVFAAYGNRCSCCGITEKRFLSLQHIHGHGGPKPRSHKTYGVRAYRTVIKEGFPKDKYTLYCMNCNWAERLGEPCPHKLARQEAFLPYPGQEYFRRVSRDIRCAEETWERKQVA